MVYLPLFCVVGTVEGAAYGRWALSYPDWAYQMGSFIVFGLPILAPAGLFAAPLVCLLLSWVHPRSKLVWRLRQVVCGSAAVLSSVALAGTLTGSSWIASLVLAQQFPVAFVCGSAVFAMVCEKFALPDRLDAKLLAA